MSPRNQVAIYSPFAQAFYEDPSSRAYKTAHGGGGAELQTTLLAGSLARRGMRVAHIVYPIERIVPHHSDNPELIQHEQRSREASLPAKLPELRSIWSALARADAEVYVFRTGLSGGISAFVVGTVFALIRRRKLVLAASNDLDFMFGQPGRGRLTEVVYRWALRRVRRIVVQSEQQLALAREALPDNEGLRLIPSFTDPAPEREDPGGDAPFLWVGRVVDYKLPLTYVDLARELPEAAFEMVAPVLAVTPPALEKELAEAVEAVANLRVEGHLRRDQVVERIGRSAAVVATSRHEGMPNVFLEAWTRGVPVISLHFDPDGIITRERTGIFADGSCERLAEAVVTLRGDPRLRDELGRNGRAYVERMHWPEAVAERWAATLTEVLNGRLRPRRSAAGTRAPSRRRPR